MLTQDERTVVESMFDEVFELIKHKEEELDHSNERKEELIRYSETLVSYKKEVESYYSIPSINFNEAMPAVKRELEQRMKSIKHLQ